MEIATENMTDSANKAGVVNERVVEAGVVNERVVEAGVVNERVVEAGVVNERVVELRVIELLHTPAGLAPFAELISIDPHTLDYAGRLDYLAALEKQTSWVNALLQNAIVAVAGAEASKRENNRFGVDDIERDDVATALRMSAGTAQMKIDVARTLTKHLPATCSALATGEISAQVASVIARETDDAIEKGLPAEAIREIEAKALAHAEFHTPIQVANKIRTTIAKLSPIEFEEAVEQATRQRSVSIYPERNGMCTLVAILPAPDAETIMLAINKMARLDRQAQIAQKEVDLLENLRATNSGSIPSSHAYGHSTDSGRVDSGRVDSGRVDSGRVDSGRVDSGRVDSGRVDSGRVDSGRAIAKAKDYLSVTLEQLRADALAQLATNYLATSEDIAPKHRRPVTLNLTMDLPTLFGFENNPGQLAGYGPIPASMARELAVDGKWKRFITDPVNGALLDYGRQTYEPPQPLVDFILARDQICRFPGCRQPGRVSDIDHAHSWETGGTTSAQNMGLLCRRHHRMKTHDGWNLVSFSDGGCLWTSPAGQKFPVPARRVDEVA